MPDSSLKFDPAAFCARPLVRRVYLALAAALAVFIATLAFLREPFRGYLAEAQIVGPATRGLDLDQAARWLKRTEPAAVVLAGSAPGPRSRSRLRMTYLAARPAAARLRLDDLATRWLYQYLPEQLQAIRREALSATRATVNAARDREDNVRTCVEVLRQQQLARYFQQPSFPPLAAAAEPAIPVSLPVATEASELRSQLDKLKLELARVLASFTDEHPQVITLRKQIAGLEQQLGLTPSVLPLPTGPEIMPPTAGAHARTGHFTSTESAAASDQADQAQELNAAISAALLELSQVTRQRQVAEQKSSERMQELAAEPTAADWSAEPAQIVTRLGGTPRMVTLALGGLLSAIAGVVMFRASRLAVLPPKIDSTRELAAILEIPVIGNARLRTAAARIRQRLFKPAYVRLAGHLAEGVIGLAAAACILSIIIEPTLAGQVLADPFGTLSEVVGRFVSSR